MRSHRALLPAFCAIVVLTTNVTAQVARGIVVDGLTNAPIRGAFIQLLNEQGQRVAAVLTMEAGEFIFRVPAGRYSLRADRIGHGTANVPVFPLAAMENRAFRITLEVAALKLPELSVRGETRCVGRPDASQQTARVWEEARKALAIAAWVESKGTANFRYRLTERELDLGLDDIGQPRMRFQQTQGKQAFFAADPDSLARFGYIQERSSEKYLYGADAELLLSNSFLNEHCFRVERRNDRPGLIGLGFEPVNKHRLPDIRGVLWLDDKSAELRFIEYGYTSAPGYEDQRYAGGRTEFEQLPNGAWIVKRWYIRAPRLQLTNVSRDPRVIGAIETGGEVLDAVVAGKASAVFVERASIQGIVFDSVRGEPIEGARVYLSGTPFAAMTGVAGWFRLDSIPTGQYDLAFEHQRADSLPIYPVPQRIQLGADGLAGLRVAIPSASSMIDAICPAEQVAQFAAATNDTSSANRGVIFGRVSMGRESFEDVEIGILWRRVVIGSGKARTVQDLSMRPHSIAIGVSDEGKYAICAVPIDHPLQLDLSVRQRVVNREPLRLLPPGFLRRDFDVSGK